MVSIANFALKETEEQAIYIFERLHFDVFVYLWWKKQKCKMVDCRLI